MTEAGKEQKSRGAPDKPRAAVSEGTVLLPRAEVLAAAHTLPAGAHDGEVELPDEQVLLLAAHAVAEVRVVQVPVVNAHAFFVEPDGPGR